MFFRSTNIQDIQPYIQLHRPGKVNTNNHVKWTRASEERKWTEASRCITHTQKCFPWMISSRSDATFYLKKKSFYLSAYLLSDGFDSLLVDPAHPWHTVLKCPDDTFHHHFHLEKKHFVITLTTKETTEKASQISYSTRVTTPGQHRCSFESRYERYFLPFLCYPGRKHFW